MVGTLICVELSWDPAWTEIGVLCTALHQFRAKQLDTVLEEKGFQYMRIIWKVSFDLPANIRVCNQIDHIF